MQQIEQTLTSLEVAEMVEKEHKYLMRDIKRFSNIMVGAKISPTEFWKDSQYTDKQGKKQPCYRVTKKGCEFIAHKTAGEKGVIFTARYINRFHEMEQAITQALPEKNPPRDYMPKVPKIATKKGAKAPALPPAANWYERNASRIRRICKMYKVSKRTLYHYILLDLGKKFNLDSANRIYKWETDRAPQYAMDVVNYFPELGEAADKYLDSLEKLR